MRGRLAHRFANFCRIAAAAIPFGSSRLRSPGRQRRWHRPGQERGADGGSDHPHQGRYRRQGHQVLLGDRPVEARRRRRHQAAPIDAAGVRQSPARNPVHHVQSQRRPRLAGAAAADPGRQWRSSGRYGPISDGSRSATTSAIAPRSSRWQPRWSARSPRPSRRSNAASIAEPGRLRRRRSLIASR